MKKGILLFLPFFIAFNVTAQTSSTSSVFNIKDNTLLWRISGNGLQKHSYLFGTMHVNDKRVFNFDDSVYLNIEKCEGMAIEVNPDEMIAYYVNNALDEKTESLKNVLTREEYSKYSKKLSTRFKKPAEQVSVADIVKEKNKWSTEMFRKGEMQTFVDAYLYGIARKQGKWVGGIEDIADQTGLIKNFDKTDLEFILADNGTENGQSAVIDKMIALYVRQDVQGMYNLFNGDGDLKDRLLTRRNVKMSRRMDSLATLRSTFFAVGAGHLAGDSGVINLLRSRGFTVEPVFSTKKIPADKYKVKEKDIPWVTVTDEHKLYAVSMPAEPTTIKVHGMIEMKFHVDLSTLTGYYSFAANVPVQPGNEDSVFNTFTQAMFSSKKPLPSEKITVAGNNGREFIQSHEGITYRTQLFFSNQVLYVSAMFSKTEVNLHNNSATRFFNSFAINKTRDTRVRDLQLFTDPVMGLKMYVPEQLQFTQQFSDHTNDFWKVTAYTCTDVNAGIYMMLFSKDIKAGYHIISDSIVHHELLNNLRQTYPNLVYKEKLSVNVRMVNFQGRNSENEALYLRGTTLVKNNRNIVVMLLGDSAILMNGRGNSIFESIQLFENLRQWSWQKSTELGIDAWLPSEIRHFASNDNEQYDLAFDTSTASSFIIIADTLSRYTHYDSDSSFWKSMITNFSGNQQILHQQKIKHGQLDGVELLLKDSSAYENHARIRLIRNDSILYRIVAYGGRSLLFSDDVNKFFMSFRIINPKASDFIRTSKSRLILEDLLKDELKYSAFAELDKAVFTVSDLPILHEYLFQQYRSPYDTGYSNSINNKLAAITGKLQSSVTVSLLKKKFAANTQTSRNMQDVILLTLAHAKTKEAYSLLGDLLQKHSMKKAMPYDFELALKDSLLLTREILPRLLETFGDTLLVPSIAGVIDALLDSSMIRVEEIRPQEKEFLNSCRLLQPRIIELADDYYTHEYSSMVSILAAFKSKESLDLAAGWLKAKGKYFRKRILLVLLKSKYNVPSAYIDEIASDPELAQTFYYELEKERLQAAFPGKYLTTRHFAESELYNVIDDVYPEKITFLQTKQAVYNERKYTFYLFSIKFEDEDNTYLGIAGGYGKDKLKPEIVLSTIRSNDDKLSAGEQLQAYLEED